MLYWVVGQKYPVVAPELFIRAGQAGATDL